MDMTKEIGELLEIVNGSVSPEGKEELNDWLLSIFSSGYNAGYDIGLASGMDHGWRNGYQARGSN